ncbi:MAG TPA: hypothetical protein VGH25_09940, partial [Dongiaceae bacterium]
SMSGRRSALVKAFRPRVKSAALTQFVHLMREAGASCSNLPLVQPLLLLHRTGREARSGKTGGGAAAW